MKFCMLWASVLADLFRFLVLSLPSESSLAAENLFLRKQLGFYQERNTSGVFGCIAFIIATNASPPDRKSSSLHRWSEVPFFVLRDRKILNLGRSSLSTFAPANSRHPEFSGNPPIVPTCVPIGFQ
jgi:hypothetical protein